jgi:hypothetical protein
LLSMCKNATSIKKENGKQEILKKLLTNRKKLVRLKVGVLFLIVGVRYKKLIGGGIKYLN